MTLIGASALWLLAFILIPVVIIYSIKETKKYNFFYDPGPTFSCLGVVAVIAFAILLTANGISQRDAERDLRRQGFTHIVSLDIHNRDKSAVIELGEARYQCTVAKDKGHWGIVGDCNLIKTPKRPAFKTPDEVKGE